MCEISVTAATRRMNTALSSEEKMEGESAYRLLDKDVLIDS
jgi:hypothetical protein